MSLFVFGDVALDLDKVVMVRGQSVLLDNGEEYGVGGAAADAIRKAIPSFPALPQGTCGTAPGACPARSIQSRSHRSSGKSSTVRAQLQGRSSDITSFPEKSSKEAKDTTPAPKGKEESR